MPIVLFNFEGPEKETQRYEGTALKVRERPETREEARVSGRSSERSERKVGLTAEGLQRGGIAQLGEHLLCKQGVNGSIPFISTTGLI